MRSGGAVGAFAENFRLYLIGIFFGNLIFNGCGNDDIAGLKKNVARTHFRSAGREILQGFFLPVNPVHHFRNVETVFVVQTAADVGKSHDFVAGLLHQFRGERAHVAEALNDYPAALFFEAQLGDGFVAAHHHAAAGGFAAAL